MNTASSQAFSSAEIPTLVLVAIIIVFLAWLLSGAVTAFGWLGIGLAMVSIVAGFAGVFQEKTIGGICSIILLLSWFLVGFLVVWWFELLGGAIGFVTGMAVKMNADSSGSLFSGKPQRILLTALAVLIIIQGSSLFQGQNNVGGVFLANYSGLEKLLQAKNWKGADKETSRLIREYSGSDELVCEFLRPIDQL